MTAKTSKLIGELQASTPPELPFNMTAFCGCISLVSLIVIFLALKNIFQSAPEGSVQKKLIFKHRTALIVLLSMLLLPVTSVYFITHL